MIIEGEERNKYNNLQSLLQLRMPEGDGPVVIAEWSNSKALPLTASCLPPLCGFESWLGHVRKLPVTWGQSLVLTR